jgi:predicted dehydrogenase
MPGDSGQRWVPLLEPGDGSLGTGNQLAIADLIEAIETDRKPVSGASDAVAALEMILGAYESHITGGRVELPMANRSHPLLAWK